MVNIGLVIVRSSHICDQCLVAGSL